jgi:hypothetical protein
LSDFQWSQVSFLAVFEVGSQFVATLGHDNSLTPFGMVPVLDETVDQLAIR